MKKRVRPQHLVCPTGPRLQSRAMRKPLLRTAAFMAHALALNSYSLAQEQDRPRPDRWRGMVLDETTPEAAIIALGKPAKDSVPFVDP